MNKFSNRVVISLIALVLTACGGGGGGSSSPVAATPAPVTPPVVVTPPAPVVPLKVMASSYENAKAMNIEQQTFPRVHTGSGPLEQITAGAAFADFFQTGKMSMVAFSNVFAGKDGFGSTVAGKVYFFEKDSTGNWIDKTSKVLADTTGCISPRKLIVADFNGDGKPDVFAACHGIDGKIPDGQKAGENPRYLMSQTDGTYKNVDAGFNCYCHGASAAELNNKGYADIVVTDVINEKQPFMLINNKNGTFTKDTTKLSDSLKPFTVANVEGLIPQQIYSTELIDLNADGKYDVIFTGDENTDCGFNCKFRQTYFYNDATLGFKTPPKFLPSVIDARYTSVIDVVFLNGKLVVLRTGLDFSIAQLQTIDLTTNTTTEEMITGIANTPFVTVANGKIVPLNTIR